MDNDSPQAKVTDTGDLRGTTDTEKDIEQEDNKFSMTTDKRPCHTLEDAIRRENTKDFLIVSEDVLAMPDCTLMIQSLSDREIEIHVDPNKQSTSVETKDTGKETEQPEIVPVEEGDPEPLKSATDDSHDESEPKNVTATMDEQQEQSTAEEVDNTVSKALDKGVGQEENQVEDTPAGPKIKIGTGKPKKSNQKKKTEDSESDTHRYLM